MANIIISDNAGDAIRVNGECYFLVGPTASAPTHSMGDVQGTFTDCDDCLNESSSSSSSSGGGGLPAGELSLVISGMPGTGGKGNWNGLGNGTHALNGTETLNDGGTSSGSHYWQYQTSGDYMYIKASFTTSTVSSSVAKLSYRFQTTPSNYTTGSSFSYNSVLNKNPVSINDRLLSQTAVLNGVTFTWSKGADWDYGNM